MRKLNKAAIKRLKQLYEDNHKDGGDFSDFVLFVEIYGVGEYTIKEENTKSGFAVFIKVWQDDFEVSNGTV